MGPRAAGLPVRAFARWLGVDEKAVRKAIATGRLERSLGRVHDRVVIVDRALAKREWFANRDPSKVRPGAPAGASATRRAPGRAQKGDRGPRPPADNGKPQDPEAETFAAVRRRSTEAQARLREMEADRRAGLLVPLAEVERREAARVVRARTKLLALTARLRHQLPHLTASDMLEIDRLVREALEELGRGDVMTEGARS
jgi:hypothetical protein